MSGHDRRHSAVSGAKMAESIYLPLVCGLGWAEESTSSIVFAMCPNRRARWRHLANTTEPSACGGDAVLCRITL